MELIEDEAFEVISFIGGEEFLDFGVITQICWRVEPDDIDHFLFLTDEVFQFGDIAAIGDEYTRIGVVASDESFEVCDSLVGDEVDGVEGVTQPRLHVTVLGLLVEKKDFLCLLVA